MYFETDGVKINHGNSKRKGRSIRVAIREVKMPYSEFLEQFPEMKGEVQAGKPSNSDQDEGRNLKATQGSFVEGLEKDADIYVRYAQSITDKKNPVMAVYAGSNNAICKNLDTGSIVLISPLGHSPTGESFNLRSEEIASTSERLSAIVLGTTDLANALRINLTVDRMGLMTSLSLCILAARAHNRCIIDGPHFDLKNIEACEFSCRQARDLGFDGKAVIHPVQIAYTNDAFTPKGEDVKRAKKIIDAIASAHEIGRSMAVIDDRLIEPSLELWARRVIALYNQVHELGQSELIGPEK